MSVWACWWFTQTCHPLIDFIFCYQTAPLRSSLFNQLRFTENVRACCNWHTRCRCARYRIHRIVTIALPLFVSSHPSVRADRRASMLCLGVRLKTVNHPGSWKLGLLNFLKICPSDNLAQTRHFVLLGDMLVKYKNTGHIFSFRTLRKR